MFFDKDGIFVVDEMVAQRATFKKIMEDGIIEDAEIEAQAALVISLYRKLDELFTEEQLGLIAEVIAETSVLHSLTKYQELQEFHK